MKANLYYADWTAMWAAGLYPHDGELHSRHYYEHVGSHEVADGFAGCEQLFMTFNRDDRPDGQIRRSMCVGDVVLDTERNEGWVCAPAGFDALTPEQFSGWQCECGILAVDLYATVPACADCGDACPAVFWPWRGREIAIAFDAARDLNEAGDCTCEKCVEGFADAYTACADALAEAYGLSIEIVRCVAGSPESWDCEQGELARTFWQRVHDHTAWTRTHA